MNPMKNIMSKKAGLLIFALLAGFLMSSLAFAQQYSRPNSTVSAGGMTPVGAATLHEAIDEVTANTSDYMESLSTNDEAHLGLSAVTDPNSSINHIMRTYVYGARTAGQTLQIRLYENSGGTLIATFPITIVG